VLQVEDELLHLADVKQARGAPERGDAELATGERRVVLGEAARPQQLTPHYLATVGLGDGAA
jgi:hypothetical protein